MSVFTGAELTYLAEQRLIRIATASETGVPDVAVAGFEVDGDAIVSGGFDISKTVRYRNVLANPRAMVIVDDLAAVDPWTPRGIKVRGTASVEEHGGGLRFRFVPEVIWSWGVNASGPGIPAMERRVVGAD